MNDHLSETSTTLQLSIIQERCARLVDGEEEIELSLEDSFHFEDEDSSDPYNSGF